MRGEALAAVINSHAELMKPWDWSLTVSKDAEMKARIRGVKSMITTFDFQFGCTLGEQLLRQTDNLGRAVQDSPTSAAQGNRLTQYVVETLLKDRTDSSFSLFCARILQSKTTKVQTIEDPKLRWKGKAPVRHEFGEQDTHHFPATLNKRIYFNAIDTVTQCLATRFEQEHFKIYVDTREILLKSFASERCDTELAEVVKIGFYQVKFCHRLQSQWGLTSMIGNLHAVPSYLPQKTITGRRNFYSGKAVTLHARNQ